MFFTKIDRRLLNACKTCTFSEGMTKNQKNLAQTGQEGSSPSSSSSSVAPTEKPPLIREEPLGPCHFFLIEEGWEKSPGGSAITFIAKCHCSCQSLLTT